MASNKHLFEWPRSSILGDGSDDWPADEWASGGMLYEFRVARTSLREGLLSALREAEVERSTKKDDLIAAVFYLNQMMHEASEEFVELITEARHYGARWDEIGAALEVSKQAAYKRFGHKVAQFRADTQEMAERKRTAHD